MEIQISRKGQSVGLFAVCLALLVVTQPSAAQKSETLRVSGLERNVEILKDKWASHIFMPRPSTICFSPRVITQREIDSFNLKSGGHKPPARLPNFSGQRLFYGIRGRACLSFVVT